VTTAEIALDARARAETDGASEPPAQPEARILDHAYDGIREYDNPLPGWWTSIFLGTIVFAGFYLLYFHVVHWGATPDEKYQRAVVDYDGKRDLRERAELASIDEKSLAERAADGKVIERGAKVFAERCASCHGASGNGLIGPNLTDEYQRHGASRLDIYKVVRSGVPGTAMIPWGDQLAPADIVAATAFVVMLRGTNVPGKQPEGLPAGPFPR
jgi:cytochrome c oxidase cbb3-type subunit 3